MELQQNNYLSMVEHSQIFSFVQPVIQMKICTHLGLSGSVLRGVFTLVVAACLPIAKSI